MPDHREFEMVLPSLRVPTPSALELGLCYGALAAWWLPSRRCRRVALALCGAALSVDVGAWVLDRHASGVLRVTFLSVGQGDCTLIEFPGAHVMVVDGGGLAGGRFDPDAMLALASGAAHRAVSDGFASLRIAGEMQWALGGDPGSDRIMEYEVKVNERLPSTPCMALCQYDRRRFGADVIRDVIRTHPLVIVNGRVVVDQGRHTGVLAGRALRRGRPST